MVGTPKLQRKASLSLSTRLNQKRHSDSPQNRLKTSTAMNSQSTITNSDSLQRSPSEISDCSDGGIECTPPHKKMAMNLDESLELSPKVFDTSFSPTCLLSQTLAIDSPEVGWKWSRHAVNSPSYNPRCIENGSIRTPDSAYAADSSFASAGSSSTEIVGNERKRSERFTSNARKDQRKIFEKELRRVENTRAEEKLKQRCAKLQEQLKSAGTQKTKSSSQLSQASSKIISTSNSLNDVNENLQPNTSKSIKMTVKFQTREKSKKPELLNDFFNDSDSDCFLLEATQEIESKIEAKTQPAFINYTNNTVKSSASSECTSIPHTNSATATTPTPPDTNVIKPLEITSTKPNQNKEKRSSFYMKFLEDDCPDDWFLSLDEAILQATQNKKPRTSLHRYKSMPAETATIATVTLNNKYNDSNCIMGSGINSSKHMIPSEGTAASSSNLSKMKRHSSINTFSPAPTNCRSRRQL